MLKKILYAFLVLYGIVTILFLLFNVLPDDPARLTLGQRTDATSIANVRKQLHLDEPMGVRYLLFLNDLSPIGVYPQSEAPYYFSNQQITTIGDKNLMFKTPYFGRSYHSKKPVWDMLTEAIPGTIILAISAIIIGIFFGVILGIISALYKDSIWDNTALIASVIGISTPSFFAGLLIAYTFGHILSAYTGFSMVGSLMEYDMDGNSHLNIRNLILPAVTLGIRPLAIIAQLTRSSMLDALSQDYIRTAKAKGLSQFKVVFKHVLPNALNPVVTAVSGWLAELMAGSFFVEFIFSWKGLGKLTVDALDKFDFPVVMGAIVFSAGIFVIMNMLTDVMYRIIDPRMRK